MIAMSKLEVILSPTEFTKSPLVQHNTPRGEKSLEVSA